jgi:hypothetical protein
MDDSLVAAAAHAQQIAVLEAAAAAHQE